MGNSSLRVAEYGRRILAQFAPGAVQPLALRLAIVCGTQLSAIQQVLEDALRFRQFAATLEQQAVAQTRLRAGVSGRQGCIDALRLVKRVLYLKHTNIQ